jgi:hypothetical protein
MILDPLTGTAFNELSSPDLATAEPLVLGSARPAGPPSPTPEPAVATLAVAVPESAPEPVTPAKPRAVKRETSPGDRMAIFKIIVLALLIAGSIATCVLLTR